MTRQEKDQLERAALAVVANHLKVEVVLHDDQTEPGMYDLEAHLRDGRWAALEMTAAEDERRAAEFGAVKGNRAFVYDERIKSGWGAVLREGAVVAKTRKHLPDALVAMEAAGLTELDAYRGWAEEDGEVLMDLLDRAQVMMVKEVPSFGPGRAALRASGQVEWTNLDPEAVVDFIEGFVASRPSDVAKLAASGADERHLFVWSGTFSEAWSVLRALGTDVDQLPGREPDLPDGVTHVWIANEMHRPSRILQWSPHDGWVEVGQVEERA